MGYYPQRWGDYIGQKDAVRQLRIKARSAKARGVTMSHTLIHSPIAGVGKSALAQLAAIELGGQLFIQTEQLHPRQVPILFDDLNDGDCLFLDEIHRQFSGGKNKAEWMLQYLDRGVIPGPLGEEEAPAVTVIAATTDIGKLPEPFQTRFELQLALEPYTDEEAALIAAKLAVRILKEEGDGLPIPTPEVCAAIGRAACNNPRDMSRILQMLRDLVWAGELDDGISDGSYDVTEAVNMAGFTLDGLNSREQKYLHLLYHEFKGQPAGADVLRSRLGEVPAGLEQVENRLMDKGLVVRTPSGRQLTKSGRERTLGLKAVA